MFSGKRLGKRLRITKIFGKGRGPNMFLGNDLGNDLDEILNPDELLRPLTILTIEKLQEHDYKPNSRSIINHHKQKQKHNQKYKKQKHNQKYNNIPILRI